MNSRAKLIATLVASGLVGFAIMVFLVRSGISAESRDRTGPGLDEVGAFPICSVSSAVLNPTFYSEMSNVNARMHVGMEVASSGNTDRDFARMMIPHHQAAIEMALLELKYGRDERLRRLAQSIIVEQGQEIAYMRTLLETPPNDMAVINRVANQ
jgi:hypothetical protein